MALTARETVKAAVKAAVEGISGWSAIATTRRGALATWVRRRRPEQLFVEITIPATRRRLVASGCGEEWFEVLFRCLMPRSTENPDSTATFDTWLVAVQEVFVTDPTLGSVVTDCELPQNPTEGELEFEGGGNTPALLCHYAEVTVDVRVDFHL